MSPPPRPRIATLEAFIIDTFKKIENGRELPVNKPSQIGGAGTYAIIGARIFLPARRLAMIVDYTPNTFPLAMRQILDSYGSDMWEMRVRDDGHETTRAVNSYEGEKRHFQYLSPPRLLYPNDLLGTRFSNPLPSWLHIVSYPDRTLQVLAEIDVINSHSTHGAKWYPGIVWEPEPPCVKPENINIIARIVQQVDVFSPNHTEAMALFRVSEPTQAQLRTTIEWLTRRMVALRPRQAAIVRAGALGCCFALTSEIPPGSVYDPHMRTPPCVPVHWVPPYWEKSNPDYARAVVDPTGAGNAFMGGLMAALDEGKTIEEATLWANVAASFVIEQDGLPRVALVHDTEVWNGDYAPDRVKALRRRMDDGNIRGGVAERRIP